MAASPLSACLEMLQRQISSVNISGGGDLIKKATGRGKFSVDRAKHIKVYNILKTELLTDSEAFRYTDDTRKWTAKMLDYNVLGGKLYRGLSVIESLKVLKAGAELSEDEIFLGSVLEWCIQWMQAYFRVLDEVLDNPVTRRGQPFWLKVPKAAHLAINDGIILRTHISQRAQDNPSHAYFADISRIYCLILRTHIPRILNSHFQKKSYYTDLLDLFDEVEFQTTSGKLLEVITSAGELNLSKYTHERYRRMIEYKTTYNSFYLPVACALIMMEEKAKQTFRSAKEVLVEVGIYFQVQEDVRNCYGDPEAIGKIGTDIEDSKCSWLIVQALQLANPKQKQCLKDNYGKSNQPSVLEVKEVYKELKLQRLFLEYQRESYSKIRDMIEKQENKTLKALLGYSLDKIYK